MAYLETFCFCCSVRLGVIVISLTNLVQGCFWLTLAVAGLVDEERSSKRLERFLHVVHINTKIINIMIENVFVLLFSLAIFFALQILSSFFMLLGAYRCKPKMMYSFLTFYALYILYMTIMVMLLLRYIEAKGSGLGEQIVYSAIVFFFLLFYIYKWMVSHSCVKIFQQLSRRVQRKLQAVSNVNINYKALKQVKNPQISQRKKHMKANEFYIHR